jgi:hypothetical protein
MTTAHTHGQARLHGVLARLADYRRLAEACLTHQEKRTRTTRTDPADQFRSRRHDTVALQQPTTRMHGTLPTAELKPNPTPR